MAIVSNHMSNERNVHNKNINLFAGQKFSLKHVLIHSVFRETAKSVFTPLCKLVDCVFLTVNLYSKDCIKFHQNPFSLKGDVTQILSYRRTQP